MDFGSLCLHETPCLHSIQTLKKILLIFQLALDLFGTPSFSQFARDPSDLSVCPIPSVALGLPVALLLQLWT